VIEDVLPALPELPSWGSGAIVVSIETVDVCLRLR
jgi:hypothetical protein